MDVDSVFGRPNSSDAAYALQNGADVSQFPSTRLRSPVQTDTMSEMTGGSGLGQNGQPVQNDEGRAGFGTADTMPELTWEEGWARSKRTPCPK